MSNFSSTPQEREWAEGPEGEQDVLRYISDTPALLSMLYDLDLLPEQHPDPESKEREQIFIIANHWREDHLSETRHILPPPEATDEMIRAGMAAYHDFGTPMTRYANIWRAMLNAAPQVSAASPSAGEGRDVGPLPAVAAPDNALVAQSLERSLIKRGAEGSRSSECIQPISSDKREKALLHPATADLIVRFCAALADKLRAAEQKYGYSDGWLADDWMDECRAKLREHITKGDPRDVAAYCAFLWHHNASTNMPGDWRICEFCGCNTNARLRLCCDKGREADLALSARTPIADLSAFMVTHDVDVDFCYPGNHGGPVDEWLVTLTNQSANRVEEFVGRTLDEAITYAVTKYVGEKSRG